jgi:hypothetical protein
MKILLFSLITIMQLYSCNSCITEESLNGRRLGTRVKHSIRKAQCSCQCTGKRTDKNQCQECFHSVAAHK